MLTALDALPEYVMINDPTCKIVHVLTTPAELVRFPLSDADQKDLMTLLAKYQQEENCAGLAAPQIGIPKRIIVFAVEDGPELKKWRPDLTDTLPQTIWFNPSYTPLGNETHTDYEGCFSVKDLAGPVARYVAIRYEATLLSGQHITGEAHGFLARVIQHEVDHINGICFTHRVEEQGGKTMTIEDYRAMRAKAMKEGREEEN